MQVAVYRKPGEKVPVVDNQVGDESQSVPLTPELFYPLVTDQEMVTWTHWLPTVVNFVCSHLTLPAEVVTKALIRHNAPPEVLEEFHWAWNMDLFEAYAVRTPVRADARDPLLLGRIGTQWYRLALWGESLLPLEEIASLVQQSLTLRARAAKQRLWLGWGGTIPALFLLFGMCYQLWEGQPVATGLFLTFSVFFLAWLPMLVYTPENRQQDFLDRYRC